MVLRSRHTLLSGRMMGSCGDRRMGSTMQGGRFRQRQVALGQGTAAGLPVANVACSLCALLCTPIMPATKRQQGKRPRGAHSHDGHQDGVQELVRHFCHIS